VGVATEVRAGMEGVEMLGVRVVLVRVVVGRVAAGRAVVERVVEERWLVVGMMVVRHCRYSLGRSRHNHQGYQSPRPQRYCRCC